MKVRRSTFLLWRGAVIYSAGGLCSWMSGHPFSENGTARAANNGSLRGWIEKEEGPYGYESMTCASPFVGQARGIKGIQAQN